MSKTVVKKHKRRKAGGMTLAEHAGQIELQNRQLKVDFYRRDYRLHPERYEGWEPPGMPEGWRESHSVG